jgi:hypothetical protein
MPQKRERASAELVSLIELALLKSDEIEELHIGALLSECLVLINERQPDGR